MGGGSGKAGLDLGTGDTVSTGGLARTGNLQMQELGPGVMVGEYRIEGTLGEGGMGRVYSATHPVIAKRAAIKILHPALSVNREAIERFVQEARAVNQIGHPNIVDIFSFGTLPDGRCYFVMEWLRGESLRDRIRRAPVPIADSLAILETISIALEAAHDKGIIHRDLKPDNVFLVDVKGTHPTVKLLDFGIAKLLASDDARVEKTRTGNLLGTPAYISPEQARGHQVDHRTDIYALGALAYELITGWLPFPADSAAEMIAKHLYEQPPSPRLRNPSIPPDLDNLVVGMLAKDPNLRPTLAQVRGVLAIYRHGNYQGAQGAHPPMHTPAPPMHTPPITGALPASGMATPYPSCSAPPGMTPVITPAPGTMSVIGTRPPGTVTGMPAASSKLPMLVIGTLLAAAVGVAVFFAVSGTKDATDTNGAKPQPAATPVETAKPAPPTDTTIPRPPSTPVEPVEPAAPATTAPDPAATAPADPAATAAPVDPAATTTPVEPAKPADPAATSRPRPAKKPATKKPPRPARPTSNGDDDAPM